jgi:hypothetical protein
MLVTDCIYRMLYALGTVVIIPRERAFLESRGRRRDDNFDAAVPRLGLGSEVSANSVGTSMTDWERVRVLCWRGRRRRCPLVENRDEWGSHFAQVDSGAVCGPAVTDYNLRQP